MKKRLCILLLAGALVLSSTGCGRSSSASAGYSKAVEPEMYDSYDGAESAQMVSYAEDAEYEGSTGTGGSTGTETENATNSNRKLIRDMSLSVETKEYDSLIKNLTSQIGALGGYVEYMDVQNNSLNSGRSSRNASLTARIPAAKLDTFVNNIGEVTNITNRTESVRDVTLSYVDIESHKNMLIAERDRLMEYLEQAETVEDMMAIEDHLTDIRYQIDSMESQLRTYDNQVDYSTVNIYINEVIEYTPVTDPEEEKTAWQRMGEGFVRSFKDVVYDVKEFFIDLVIDLPYIILFLVKLAIVLIIIRLVILSNKRLRNWYNGKKEELKAYRAEKKAAKAQKKAAKAADKEENIK
ncbi:MAG: DUF4349 domain-containing protein [Lachnospiraceae bacterium]|nr:DUF4349 domain-containing protein [Lachnospiraceae bacterium]